MGWEMCWVGMNRVGMGNGLGGEGMNWVGKWGGKWVGMEWDELGWEMGWEMGWVGMG